MKRPEAPIVGRGVRDQRTLRRPKRPRDLDEFLEFLACVEGMFGAVARKRDVTRGEAFRL